MCSHFFSRTYYIYLSVDGGRYMPWYAYGGWRAAGQRSGLFPPGGPSGIKLKSSGLMTRTSASWTIWQSLQILTGTHLYLRFLKHYLPHFPICPLLRKVANYLCPLQTHRSSRDPLSQPVQHWAHRSVPLHLAFMWVLEESELGSSCLFGKHFSSWACHPAHTFIPLNDGSVLHTRRPNFPLSTNQDQRFQRASLPLS